MNTNNARKRNKIVRTNVDLRSLNEVGKRIIWCRQSLGLSVMEVCRAVKIPRASYTGRENGVRAQYHEEYLALAEFFDSKWKAKFGQSFPVYGGNEIAKIKVEWVMFGLME